MYIMKVTLNIEKRYAYSIIGVLILLTGIFAVNALAPGATPNPGHSISEIGIPSGCTTGQVLSYDGSSLKCSSASTTTSTASAASGEVKYSFVLSKLASIEGCSKLYSGSRKCGGVDMGSKDSCYLCPFGTQYLRTSISKPFEDCFDSGLGVNGDCIGQGRVTSGEKCYICPSFVYTPSEDNPDETNCAMLCDPEGLIKSCSCGADLTLQGWDTRECYICKGKLS